MDARPKPLATIPESRIIKADYWHVHELLYENNLSLWDIAAGIILIKEAGGVLNEIDLSANKNIKIIASSSDINSKLVEKLTKF